jgi:hypothetical protein
LTALLLFADDLVKSQEARDIGYQTRQGDHICNILRSMSWL